MIDINKGGSAFPYTVANGANSVDAGMTLRDYFAAKAMAFEIEDYWNDFAKRKDQTIDEFWREDVADSCYAMADAMLKARGQ